MQAPPATPSFATPPLGVHKFNWGTEGTPRRSKRAKTTGARSPWPPSTAQSKKGAKALEVLRHSNRVLEQIIAERRQHESMLETQLNEAQQSLKRSKDNQLRETVKSISSSLFLLVVMGLLLGLYRMFSPHFDSMIMAGLVALVLKEKVQTKLRAHVRELQKKLGSISRKWLVALNVSLFGVAVSGHLAVHLLVSLLYVIQFVLINVDNSTVAAATLTIGVSAGLCLPLLLVLRSSAVEVDAFVKLAMRLLQDKQQTLALYQSVSQGPARELFLALNDLGAFNLSSELVGERLTELGAANSALALGLVTNLSNVAWACGIFASTLFWLLKLDLGSIWESMELDRLSPLLPQDNEDVLYAIKQGSLEVFVGSALVGLVHGLVTFTTLSAVGSPLTILPATLSCVLAVAPLLGSFIIWTPFVVALFALDRVFEACLTAGLELFTMFLIEPYIVSQFPTAGRFFGLPIVCGLFAFGPCGVVFGPLVIALASATAKIFHRYVVSAAAVPIEMDDFTVVEEDPTINTAYSFSTHHNSPVPMRTQRGTPSAFLDPTPRPSACTQKAGGLER